MFVYNTIWLHVHVPIIMLLMNNTRHLLISFQRTISVFYVADSDECTSLHFCSNRLLREMTIKIMFPTTKKKWVCYLQKKKNNFFFKYIDEALLQKSDVAMVLSLLTIEKSELCENFKQGRIYVPASNQRSFFLPIFSELLRFESWRWSFPRNIKYHA